MELVYGDKGLVVKYIQIMLKSSIDHLLNITGVYDEATHIAVKKYLITIDPRLKYHCTDTKNSSGDLVQVTEEGLSYLLDFVIHPKRSPSKSLYEAISTESFELDSTVTKSSTTASAYRSAVAKSIVEDDSLWKVVPKTYVTSVKCRVYYWYMDNKGQCIYLGLNGNSVGVAPENWYNSLYLDDKSDVMPKYDYKSTINNLYLYEYSVDTQGNCTYRCDKLSSGLNTDIYKICAINDKGEEFFNFTAKVPTGVNLSRSTTSLAGSSSVNYEDGYWYVELTGSGLSSLSSKYFKKFWTKDYGCPSSDIEEIDYAQDLLRNSIYHTANYYPEVFSGYLCSPEVMNLGYDSMTDDIYKFLSTQGVASENQFGVIDPRTEELFRRYGTQSYIIE